MTDCLIASIIFVGFSVLIGAVIPVLVAISWTPRGYDDEPREVEALGRVHRDTVTRIDDTADYYAGLFRYVSRRLDEETRRRQSS